MKIASLLFVIFLFFGIPSHAQDVGTGAIVFKRCMNCHDVGVNAVAKIGPPLNGVVGRSAGFVEDFKYSEALLSAGITWDDNSLTGFLRGPKIFVPGTKMAFTGLKTDEEIANLIAYLRTFDAEGRPLAQ